MRSFVFGVLPVLTACTTAPSHIPNPLLLPVQGASAAIGNSIYETRRSKVKTFVTKNWPQVLADISNESGPTMTQAMTLARVSPIKRPALMTELARHAIHRASPENLTVALMVHSD